MAAVDFLAAIDAGDGIADLTGILAQQIQDIPVGRDPGIIEAVLDPVGDFRSGGQLQMEFHVFLRVGDGHRHGAVEQFDLRLDVLGVFQSGHGSR